MHLKTHRVKRHGKEHVYYSLCESVRVSRRRVVQRQVLHLGELQGSQVEQWERTIAVLTESGEERQMQLWAGRPAPAQADCVEVVLSSLSVRRPRRFGDCWAATKLWGQLDLDGFFAARLEDEPGMVPWAKVIELLVVSRLCSPGSELSVHKQFYPQSAIGWLLDTDAAVAEKDRLYRALDRLLPHKADLEQHLARRWKDLFGVTCDLLLYDLTSSYFEGEAAEVEQAARGYSRDHRPDCEQVVLALIVTPEGLPVAYELFDGNRVDVTTLLPMIDHVEARHGKMGRVWVFDRGIVSEDNLDELRARGGHYLVGAPRSALGPREAHLLTQDWQAISPEVEVKLLPEDAETYVLARSRPPRGQGTGDAHPDCARPYARSHPAAQILVEGPRAARPGVAPTGPPGGTPRTRLALRPRRVRRQKTVLALGPRAPAQGRLARRRLSAAHQSDVHRSHRPLAPLCAALGGRSGVSSL